MEFRRRESDIIFLPQKFKKMNKGGIKNMKKKMSIGERVADEYFGVCNLALFFVAGCVGWMELVGLIRGIGEFIVKLV